MYGQGNYAPPFGQRLPAPPPPPLQQGPPAPHHPIAQQGHPSVLPPVVQHGIPAYGQASSAPHSQVPHSQVPPSGMLSSGQSYLIPPPPPPQMHGSASVPHSYSTSQQNTQWTQNAHHISPQLPPIGHHPPPRMIPPPLPQGQPFYRGPIHPPQPGGVPTFQHMPLPPPPTSTSQYFMPSPVGPFIQSGHESHSPMGLLPPPPPPLPPPPPSSPPPGPPPLPPSSPPPTSSLPSSAPLLAASNLGNISRKPSDVEAMASDLVDSVSDPQNSSDDGLKINNTEGDTHSAVGSLLKPGESSEGSLKLNLPSPPPRPAEENIVRKIEVLCHYIAKNGHKFEDMTRQKEFGNPEFDFLFGGEPGSDAAIAHEYFIWMKKKSSLTDELPEGGRKDDSSLRQSGSGSSLQLDAGASHSAVDSDMDMEDDITPSDEAPGICKTLGSADQESDLAAHELDTTEPLHPDDLEHFSDKDAIPTNLISSGSSGLVEPEPSSEGTVKRFHVSPNENLKQYDALAAAGDSSVKVTSHSSNGASPFRLLQDYASDDSSENVDEPCVEDVSAAAVSPTNRAGARSSDIFLTNSRIKDLPDLKKGVGSSSMSVETSSLGIRSKSPAPYTELEGAVRKTDTSTGSADDEQREDSPENHDSLDSGSSHGAFQEKDYLAGGGVDAAPEKTATSQKENLRSNSNQVKVDEFGRLQRAGTSDSDSDDLHYTRRRGKRGRSWSRSRSPKDRRRRRSPLRRREKRSRSRSRSPKKRRSRSKSPSYRRGGEAGSDRSRRERGQLPDCFDFLRGKCFRGASCRYFHDSDKVEGSRQQKGRQQHEDVSPILKVSVKSVHQRDEADRPAMQLYQDVPGNSVGATQDGDVCQEANLVTTRTSDRPPSDICGESLVTDVVDCGITQGLSIQEQEMRDIQEEPVQSTSNLAQTASCLDRSPLAMNSDKEKLLGDISQGKPSSFGQMMDQRFQDKFSDPLLQNSDIEPQKDSSTSASAPAEASTIGSQLPLNEPLASQSLLIQSNPDAGILNNTYSSDYTSSRESLPLIPAHLSHPQLPLPPGSQGINIPFPPQLPSDYSMMPSTAKYPSHSSSGENYTPYQAPMPYQHSHFSAPQTSSWNFLPPPPPRGPHAVSLSQFPQNQLPPGSDYSSQTLARPYAAELPIHSQVGEFPQGRYPPVQELDRRLSHMEEFRARTLPVNYSMTHQFGVSNLMGEDNARPPLHGLISSNSYAQSNIHHQPGHFSRDSPSTRIRSLSGDILPPEELPLPSAEVNPYLPPYGLLGPEVNNASVNLGESGKINSRYSSDFLDRTQLSHVSDFGRSRISNHYNPYASTFDQSLSAKFSLNVLNQEKDTSYRNKYSGWSSLSHVPADGQGSGNLSARNLIPSPNSAQGVAQMLPKSGSDQYDPIYDSIEPSSSSFRRSDHSKKREADDSSDVMLRLSASNKPHDLAENSAQKETGTVALSASAENDEFGETADAEVGAVENGSPSDPIDLEKLAAGDIEIDQVNTPGKSKKKSKDSRSMKLFKVSLADFVKEVLKPSWRQGNMSKEAFKTIVKKTVDKVSGAMKSHQVPKSQAKINHYIDSSQRKLTKLVMGYVDKYVKV